MGVLLHSLPTCQGKQASGHVWHISGIIRGDEKGKKDKYTCSLSSQLRLFLFEV